MISIDQLTNDEIRDELTARGYDAGPVVEGTRNVYIKKLRRLIEEEQSGTAATAADALTPRTAAPHTPNTDSLEDSPKRAQVSRSPQKSRLPANASRAAAQEVNASPKRQALPHTPPKAGTRIPPEAATPPKPHDAFDISENRQSEPNDSLPRASLETEYFSPQSRHASEAIRSAPKLRATPESMLRNVIRDPVKVSESYSYAQTARTAPKTYCTTPTAHFTSLSDNRKKEKERDGSDEDFYGEESSRILSPNRNYDHTYSAPYSPGQGSAKRFGSGRGVSAFENSYSTRNSNGVYGRRNSGLAYSKPASGNYRRIGFALLVAVILAVFIFFVVQNYAALEQGEANKEEL